MKVIENPFLNSHYYISKDVFVKNTDIYYNTINPYIIHNIINNIDNIDNDNDARFILKNNKNISNYKSLYNYVLLSNKYMFEILKTINSDIDIYDWLIKFWNQPFLVSNPIYVTTDSVVNNNKLCFSNVNCKSIELINTENEYDEIIANGCFSIGNGIIVALSLISSGYWKGSDFIKSIYKLIDNKILEPLIKDLSLYNTYFFTNLKGDWNYIFNIFPYQIIDNTFKYSFIFNSPKIYKFMLVLSNIEDSIIPYRVNNTLYLTSIVNYIKNKQQYDLFINTRSLFNLYEEPLSEDLYDLIDVFSFNYYNRINNIIKSKNLYKYFINSNKYDIRKILTQNSEQVYITDVLFNIVKAISQLYRNYNKYYRKRLTLFWNKINNTFPNKIIKYIRYHFIYSIVLNKNKQYIPLKLLKTIIFKNKHFEYFSKSKGKINIYSNIKKLESPSFVNIKNNSTVKFNVSFKEIFNYLNDNCNITDYKNCIEKRIANKLLYLKKIGDKCKLPNSYLVSEVMKYDYYWDNKEELWK